eukprot:1149513-Pelagomonas_calceolata.AAC.4
MQQRPKTRAGVAGFCSTSQQQTSVPTPLYSCNSHYGGLQSPQTIGPPPDPGTSKGIHKSVLIRLCYLELFRGPGSEQLTSSSKLPKITMCPALLPTAPEATKTWNPCTSHCLPHPIDTSGLPSSFAWEGSQSFGGGCAGRARAAGVKLTKNQAHLGAHAP